MTTTSYNGWPASKNPADIGIVPLVVAGIDFPGGCVGGDVHTVFEHILTEYHHKIEPLIVGQCWGYSYRLNRNADNISCHGSGTAVDANSARHPNGVAVGRTFTKAQIAGVHEILASIPELADLVHWGGDWTMANGLTPDSMHFELHSNDRALLARVAQRIKEADVSAADVWDYPIKNASPDGPSKAVQMPAGKVLTDIELNIDNQARKLAALKKQAAADSALLHKIAAKLGVE